MDGSENLLRAFVGQIKHHIADGGFAFADAQLFAFFVQTGVAEHFHLRHRRFIGVLAAVLPLEQADLRRAQQGIGRIFVFQTVLHVQAVGQADGIFGIGRIDGLLQVGLGHPVAAASGQRQYGTQQQQFFHFIILRFLIDGQGRQG